MGDKSLHELLGNMFSVNLVLVSSQKTIDSGVDISKAFRNFTQIPSLNGNVALHSLSIATRKLIVSFFT
jgi:hypothetical protein